MTIHSDLATLATSISNLTIPGMTIADISKIPTSLNMLGPMLIPQPVGFITNVMPKRVTYGSNGTAKIDLTYTLHYVYVHVDAGSGVGAFDTYAALIAAYVNIMVAIMSNDAIAGCLDMQATGIPHIGIIKDPADKEYWGFLLDLNILELAN